MNKNTKTIIALIIIVTIALIIIPKKEEEDNTTFKLIDKEGNVISEARTSTTSQQMPQQIIDAIKNNPQAQTLKIYVTITNTGEVPIEITIQNARSEAYQYGQ